MLTNEVICYIGNGYNSEENNNEDAMVRQIHLKELKSFDDKRLGAVPTAADYTELINEDCDVFRPDGTLAVAFRKRGLKAAEDIAPGNDKYRYWQWACKSLLSDQRGNAAGAEITTNVEIRLTEGQKVFFSRAVKGQVANLEEARAIIESDTRVSRTTYFVGKTEADGLVDLEEIERWDSLVRKKSTPFDVRQEAIANRNKAKLAWFENWLVRVWDCSEDRKAAAVAGKKRYVTNQPRGQKVYSAVLGVITRSGRTPFGRLTSPTMADYDGFASFKDMYKEVDSYVKSWFPKEWKTLKARYKNVADDRYSLFGTVFSSITCNWNFTTCWHRDGANAKDAVAALVCFDRGDYDGVDFVMAELGLAFHMRHGDILIGDNQGITHAQTPFIPKTEDAENLILVFYSRDAIVTLDSLECEVCRREFMDWVVQNHPERTSGEPKWNGSFVGMWSSPEWMEYKKIRKMEQCSNTNIKGTPDTFYEVAN
jgi:hypothetical protein